jgi:hypothetical protein
MEMYRWAVLWEYLSARSELAIVVAMVKGRLGASGEVLGSPVSLEDFAASEERMSQAAKTLLKTLPASAGNSQRMHS